MKKLKQLKQQFPAIVRGALADTLGNKVARVGLVGASLLAGGNVHADGGAAPLDFSATATTIAGYVPAAATAGLTIFAAVFGVLIIKRVFMTVA